MENKVMEKIVAESLREECARLGVRFDGELAGLLWFADRKQDEGSNGAGFVIKADLAEPKSVLAQKLYDLRQRFLFDHDITKLCKR
jgi:hypothetical protein